MTDASCQQSFIQESSRVKGNMSRRLFNPLWLHFTESEPGKAKCVHCDQIVSRGKGGSKNQNTTNIWKHLETHHKELYRDTKRRKEEMMKGGTILPQQLEMSTQAKPDKWKESDTKSKKLDKLIIEMCATDELPFSVVRGRGFQRLLARLEPKYDIKSEKFYRQDQLELLYKTVQTAVRRLIAAKRQEPSLSFTVDCVPGAEESLMSLTGHFIDERWEHRQVVLHVKAVTEASTGDYIHQFFLPLLKYWSIDQRRVFLVMRDGGADISEEQSLKEIPGLSCSAHALHSVVEEGIRSQPDAADVIAKVRAFVGHFRNSILAKQRIRVIQNELNVPQNDLEHDKVAQWISTLQMLKCAYEQKRAFNCYTQKYGHLSELAALTNEEWDLVKSIIETLSTVEEVAREMSNTGSLISCVIPSVSVLKMFLQSSNVATTGVTVLRETMLRSLEQRYAQLEETKPLVLATLLDPRYKCNVLSPKALSHAPKWLSEEHAVWKGIQEEEGEEERAEPTQGDVTVVKEEEKPSGAELVEQIFASLLGSPSPVVEHRSPEVSGQLEQYLNEPLIDRKQEDPLIWWKNNMLRFDLLAPLARKLLSAPPACVPTPRMFGFADRGERGSQANGENAEKVYFLKHNLPFLKYEY